MGLYNKTTPEHNVLERHEGQNVGFLVGKTIRGKIAITNTMRPNTWKNKKRKTQNSNFPGQANMNGLFLYNHIRAYIGVIYG